MDPFDGASTATVDDDPIPKPNHHASDDGFLLTEPTKERGWGRGRNQRTDTKPSKPAPEYRNRMFVEPITELYGAFAFLAMPFKPAIGQVIAQQAEPCAEAWDYAAKENKSVRRFLTGILTVSVYGKLAAAHLPIVVAVMAENEQVRDRMAQFASRYGETPNDDE